MLATDNEGLALNDIISQHSLYLDLWLGLLIRHVIGLPHVVN